MLAVLSVRAADGNSPLTRDEDYQRTLSLLHLALPASMPPMTEDPNRPADYHLSSDNRHWTDAAGNGVSRSAWGSWTNYDETRANPCALTEPLRLAGGGTVKDAATWWRQRRPEILKAFQTEFYGAIPRPTPGVIWEQKDVDPSAVDGAATLKTLVGHIDNSAYPSANPRLELMLWTPKSAAGPVPVMVSVAGTLPAGPSKFPPALKQVLALGWGYAIFATNSVQADSGNGLQSGIIGLVNRGEPRGLGDWGALAAWSWGLSRTIDYFETDRAIDASRLGIEGHSRWGKTALLAAAYDPRWAICYTSCSGEGGAKPSRRNWGETLDNVAGTGEYHWMAGNFLKYAGHWDKLPVDAPDLMALVAPRPLFVTGGTRDQWADPRGEFLAAVAVGPVYRLLGKRDLGTTILPAPDVPLIAGDIAFRYHEGGHTDELDWPTFLQFSARYFGPPSQTAVR